MKVPWYSIFSFWFLFFLILFYLEATVKEHLDENKFRHSYGYDFKKVSFWKLLDISCFQGSQQLWGTWTTTFETHLTGWRFYRYGSTYVLILSWINILKRKWAKMPWKLLVAQKSEPVLWRTFARHFTYYYILLFLWNKLSFKYEPSVDRIILTEICLSYTFWYSVHIVKLLLSMKYTYLLTAKITPEVNKSNFTWCEGAIVVLMWLFDYLIWCLIMASTKFM